MSKSKRQPRSGIYVPPAMRARENGNGEGANGEPPHPAAQEVEIDVPELLREKHRCQAVHDVLAMNGPLNTEALVQAIAKYDRSKGIRETFKKYMSEQAMAMDAIDDFVEVDAQLMNTFHQMTFDEVEDFMHSRRFLFGLMNEKFHNSGFGYRVGVAKTVAILKKNGRSMSFERLTSWIQENLTSYRGQYTEPLKQTKWSDKWFLCQELTPENIMEMLKCLPGIFEIHEDRVILAPKVDDIPSLHDPRLLPAYQSDEYRDLSRQFILNARIYVIEQGYLHAVLTNGPYKGRTIYGLPRTLGVKCFDDEKVNEKIVVVAHFTLGFKNDFNATRIIPSPELLRGPRKPERMSEYHEAFQNEKQKIDLFDLFLQGQLEAKRLPFKNMGEILTFAGQRPHLYHVNDSIEAIPRKDRHCMMSVLENIPGYPIARKRLVNKLCRTSLSRCDPHTCTDYIFRMVGTLIAIDCRGNIVRKGRFQTTPARVFLYEEEQEQAEEEQEEEEQDSIESAFKRMKFE